jgi:N utilization substance protein A
VRLASELTGWKIDLYSSREWLERAGEAPLFAPLPEEAPDDAADVKLSEIQGLETATVAVLEEAGYRTLNDVIDLERDDLLRLPGIAPGEADRIMAIINELTEEGAADDADGQTVAAKSSETADAGAHTDATAGAASGGSGSENGGGASG